MLALLLLGRALLIFEAADDPHQEIGVFQQIVLDHVLDGTPLAGAQLGRLDLALLRKRRGRGKHGQGCGDGASPHQTEKSKRFH